LLPLAGFSFIFGTALVTESEGGVIAASIVCNSSYGVLWYLLARIKSVTVHWGGPVAVWDAANLRIISAELGAIVLFMGVALLLQSRKRSFV